MSGECEKCGEHALECECKWISVRGIPPQQFDRVIVSDGFIVTGGFYQDGMFGAFDNGIGKITHWTLFPKPPKE